MVGVRPPSRLPDRPALSVGQFPGLDPVTAPTRVSGLPSASLRRPFVGTATAGGAC